MTIIPHVGHAIEAFIESDVYDDVIDWIRR